MSASDALEDRKGEPIKLINGTAKKHKHYLNAWLDTGKAPTEHFYYVIIEKPDPEAPEHTYLECFRAKKFNCVEPDPAPQTYLQAAFQQVPALGERLTDFSRMVAKCRIQRSRELSNVIKEYLD